MSRCCRSAPFYRLCWEDGTVFDYANDQDALDRQIHALNPGRRRRLRNASSPIPKAVFDEGYLKLGAVPFLTFRDMISGGAATGAAARPGAASTAWSRASSRTSTCARPSASTRCWWAAIRSRPRSIYALIHALERRWGVWFPRGGTGALVDGMVTLFEDIGGKLRLNAPVERIETEGDRASGVRLEDGRCVPGRRRRVQCRRRAHLRQRCCGNHASRQQPGRRAAQEALLQCRCS